MKSILRHITTTSLMAVALLLAHLPSQAQTFPTRPLRIVIPNPPGVPNDIIARGLSQYLGPRIGQPIVVENRAGADGAIGMEACARAAPDGYTMCFAAQGAIVVSAFLRSNLPYDPVRDFMPVIRMGFFDSGLAVHPSVAAASFKELAESARARPNGISWGVFSFNSSGNFYAEWLRKTQKLDFYVVPYKAPTTMLQALLTGEVQAGVQSLASITRQLAGGKLRLLAVTSDERLADYPNVPTFSELGIKLPLRGWIGIVGPSGMPRDTTQWINTEIGKLAMQPEFRERMLAPNGVLFVPNTADEFAAFLKANREGFAELLRFVPVKAE